jgi:DNA-binding transcriptional ArsR family regulator
MGDTLVRPIREGKFNYYDLTEQGRTLTETVGRFGDRDDRTAIALLRQASDTTRLQILVTLSEGDRNVDELCSDLGGMSQPAVSHHLALLRSGGLVESRKVGKFSYYSLGREGRELTLLVAPMMAAKARADTGPAGHTFEAEAIDFSDIPDDWMHDPPSGDDVGDGDESESGEAPPAHMLCRRVLVMVQELHRRGHERLRIAPGISPSGLHWRCSIIPVDRVRRDHGALAVGGGDLAACYSSGQGARFFDWPDAEQDAPVALAGKFLDRFPDLASRGRGSDPEYARWYAGMLRATTPDGLIYAYADWDLPEDHIPVLGCTSEVKIPLPPPGSAESGG